MMSTHINLVVVSLKVDLTTLISAMTGSKNSTRAKMLHKIKATSGTNISIFSLFNFQVALHDIVCQDIAFHVGIRSLPLKPVSASPVMLPGWSLDLLVSFEHWIANCVGSCALPG